MPQDTPPDADKSGESTRDSDDADAGKTYSGKDMERVVKQRLDREQRKFKKQLADAREEAVAQWREDNGLDDAILDKLSEGQSVDSQLKAELRTSKTEATKRKNALEALQAKHEKAVGALRASLVNDALLREAAGKFVDPQDAVDKLARRFRFDEDEYSVYIADDKGEPSGQTVSELVEGLLKAKPHLAVPSGDMGAGSRVSRPAESSDTAQTTATKEGRLSILEKGLG